MKLPAKRKTPINKAERKSDGGSVALEAALVMPTFLLAALFLIFLVQTSVTAMALHGALSQTVRQAASEWYPVALGLDSVRETPVYAKSKQLEDKLAAVGDTLAKYGSLLPSPLAEWAEQAADGSWSVEQIAARRTFGALLESFLDRRVLEADRVAVVSVEIPGTDDPNQAFLTVKAEYRLPMRIPFVGRSLTITESARERVWTGGSPSNAKLEDGEQPDVLSFVSFEPNPARRGRKVTLTLRAKPGEKVDLSVIYKSGLSQAKHLGEATADASGLVSWTWHVSGNTTPGEWYWEAMPEDGAVLRQSFEVVRAAER
ncbi:hypothetical protein [Cohnella thermotolerans]|uniref:hypothetical protein n=1 Tax=Cohnella thermotolerans TaxID=329858 RepID=UPI000406D0D9|nr:hypothetical protein [Cohnella thermotolerans]